MRYLAISALCALLCSSPALAIVQGNNDSRDSYSSDQMDCIRTDLGAVDWHGRSFQNGRLVYTGLRDANLRGSNFRDAELKCVDLRGADLRDADFSGARLVGVDMSDAKLAGARF